jgi:hypothetical protein
MQLLLSPIGSIFSFALLAMANPAPQGVYDLLAPSTPPPPGSKQTVDYRFGMTTIDASAGNAPAGAMLTVCDATDKLSMTLRNGVLLDKQGRIGCIVANRQFQFDGPPAQAGAIYTAGWSVCPDSNTLALGGCRTFYKCPSGDCKSL